MSEISNNTEIFITDAMRELGITDLDISNPNDYHDPVTRMYAGASVPAEANEIYRLLHARQEGGRTNLSIAFDLVSQNGSNPFKEGRSEIGKVGTALYDATDMGRALEGIPLNEASTSMTINGTAPFELASYIVAAERTGVPKNKLRGTVQNDILKEHFRNTVSADLGRAFELECDIIEYCTAQKNVPGWFGVSASGYHVAEAGASASRELAITQANVETVLDNLLARGYDVTDVAKKLSFFYVTRPDNFIEETAKLRAARIIWANRLREKYGTEDPKSQKMRIHVHTAGESMPRQYLESGTLMAGHSALSAQLAPAQSLHVVGFREAITIPDEHERTIAMYTPKLQAASVQSLRAIIDSSAEFRALVNKHVADAAEVLLEIQQAGGSVESLRDEIAQRMVAEDFVRRTLDKDSGDLPVLGRSLGPREQEGAEVEVYKPDEEVITSYLRDLHERLGQRDEVIVGSHIAELGRVAAAGINIMEATISAARDGVTVWEWNEAVREAIGVDSRPLLLESERRVMSPFAELETVRNEVQLAFADKPPKIYMAKVGLDGHDRGVKMAITIAEGSGFDVVQGTYRMQPREIVDAALEAGADLIGISILSGSHNEQVADMVYYIDEILGIPPEQLGIVIGGTIPKADIMRLMAYPYVRGVVDAMTDPTIEDIGRSFLAAATYSEANR